MKAYITLNSDNTAAEIVFDYICSQALKNEIRRQKWLRWEKRKNQKGKETWRLIADLSDKDDLNEWGQSRLQQLASVMIDDGLILCFRRLPEETYSLDLDQYVYGRVLNGERNEQDDQRSS